MPPAPSQIRPMEAARVSGTVMGKPRDREKSPPATGWAFGDVHRRGLEGWGCPEPHPPALMAAPSGLTRFTTSGRSGPHPSKTRRDGLHTAAQGRGRLFLRLTPGEDARHEVQDVGCTRLIIPVIADQATLHHVDFFLGRLVHHVGHDRAELD